jgi:predicted DNA binding protein
MAASGTELIYATVDMWHPGCWALQVTEGVDGGMFGYEMTLNAAEDAGELRLYRVYGRSHQTTETIVGNIQESDLTTEILLLSPSTSTGSTVSAPVTQDVLVEFDPAPCVRNAFISRGFLHYGPSQHEGGRERRSLLTISDRDSVDAAFDEIRTEYEAELVVERITSTSPPDSIDTLSSGGLSPAQRKAFQLARTQGYYEYPRKVTASELADQLGVTKSTFIEHIRKAENSILTRIEI